MGIYCQKALQKTGNYNRITDKGPLKGKDELTVKDHWTSDYQKYTSDNLKHKA